MDVLGVTVPAWLALYGPLGIGWVAWGFERWRAVAYAKERLEADRADIESKWAVKASLDTMNASLQTLIALMPTARRR